MLNRQKFLQFKNSDGYSLFVYLQEEYIKTLLEKMLATNDKEELYKIRQQIEGVQKFKIFIDYEPLKEE
jgi:hypothetical protein